MTVQLYAEECEVHHYMELGIEYPATEFNLFDEYRLDLCDLKMGLPCHCPARKFTNQNASVQSIS